MNCLVPIWLEETSDRKGQYVPCGRCYDCLQNKRNVWTFRMMQENKVAESSYFITLTYDEENVPITDLYGYPLTSLYRNDLTKFFKRLRSNITKFAPGYDSEWFKVGKSGILSPKIRYFACGEYGKKGDRPHYHIILWNLPDYFVDYDKINEELYSDFIDETWNKGIIDIKEVTQARMHYVAKYTLDPLIAYSFEYENKEKPFATMSRHPGIGANYASEDIKKHYENENSKLFAILPGNYKQSIGRYLKEKIQDDWSVEKRIEKKGQLTEYVEELKRKDEEKYGDGYNEMVTIRQKFNKMKVKNIIKAKL